MALQNKLNPKDLIDMEDTEVLDVAKRFEVDTKGNWESIFPEDADQSKDDGGGTPHGCEQIQKKKGNWTEPFTSGNYLNCGSRT